MNPHEDACGQAMLAYHKGERACEIIERDDGTFDVTNGPASYFADFKDWLPHQKRGMRFVRGRVLDIGCGG